MEKPSRPDTPGPGWNILRTVPVILFGAGARTQIGIHAKPLGRKALVLAGSTISKQPAFQEVLDALGSEGIEVSTYVSVPPEPDVASVERCIASIGDRVGNVLVGVGGGSTLDMMKSVAILATNGGSIRDYYGVNTVKKPPLKMVAVPTTAGSGSEVSMSLNVVDYRGGAGMKMAVNGPNLLPSATIIDPELMVTLPPQATAAAGIDSLSHALDCYLSRNANSFTDLYTLEACRLLATYLPRAVADGTDLFARTEVAKGNLYSALSLPNAGCCSIHALALPIGARLSVAHGVSLAVVLPAALRYNLPAIPHKLARLAHALGVKMESATDEALVDGIVASVAHLLHTVGIPTRLSEIGVTEDMLEGFVEDIFANRSVARLVDANPRPLAREDFLEIYKYTLSRNCI